MVLLRCTTGGDWCPQNFQWPGGYRSQRGLLFLAASENTWQTHNNSGAPPIMSNIRFQDKREHRFEISKPTSDDPVLIVCPKCAAKAVVIPLGEDKVRASCLACAFSADRSTNGRAFYWHDEDPGDGYFGYHLWLTSECDGHSLWAFNVQHLELLEAYVSANLRERDQDEKLGWRNASIASRLPKWLKSAKNREVVLKAIHELKQKI